MSDIRPGEIAVDTPAGADAGVWFIGRIRTPWTSRSETPRQGSLDGPVCRIEVFAPWDRGLDATSEYDHVQVLYWLHEARRDLVRQSPKRDGATRGVFSLRSPVRPNPIGSSIVKLERIEGSTLFVRGLDCLDGTPLVDLKPERCAFSPPPA
jgi:tRNA-Thr(GGU) m(6)t(6)A37 methyltransferase TsaA